MLKKQSLVNLRVAIIGGGGWLGKAITQGLIENSHIVPQNIVLTGRQIPVNYIPQLPGIVFTTDNEAAAAVSDVVIMSIRPQHLKNLNICLKGKLVISVMAGITVSDLENKFRSLRIVRCMPNAAAACQTSYTPWYARQTLNQSDERIAMEIFNAIGQSDRLKKEQELDVFTVLSGTGPAFPALLASSLIKAAKEHGIDDALAQRAITQTLRGTVDILSSTLESPQGIVEQFVKYGGVTGAGLTSLEQHGFSYIIRQGVRDALAAMKHGE